MGDSVICGSWPYCHEPPAPGGRFCARHQQHLDNVKRTTGSVRPAVKVSHAPKRKPQQKSMVYRDRILAVLATGPLYSSELLERCGGADDERSLKRVRRMMLKAGEIVEGPQKGHQRQYALA